MTQPNLERAKNEALKLLNDFDCKEPPVNPIKMARTLGIKVCSGTFSDKCSDVSGYFDSKKNMIVINKEEYFPRKMFAIAHEIGHYVLHNEWLLSQKHEILYRKQLGHGKDNNEKEANKFAAHLMAPKFMLDEYYEKIYKGYASTSLIAEIFAVSALMMKIRLKEEYGYK